MRASFPSSFSVSRAAFVLAVVAVAGACASAPKPAVPPTPMAAKPDPRVGLKAGLMNAGEAVSGMKITAKAVSPPGFLGITNSDLVWFNKHFYL